MKNRRIRFVTGLVVLSALAFSLTGCGERRGETQTEAETEIQTEPATVKQTETETESETQKLITSVDYTSKDGTVKITLPDNTWKVTQDADEMRVFSSGSAAMINIVHASTQSAMNNLNVMTTEDELKASLTKQYSDTNAYEVESFENNVINGVNTYRYKVKYNATARMWAYSVTYGIVAQDQAYVITGTVTDENKTLLASVEKSVQSFRVLKDETLKTVTSDVISGKTQKTNTSASSQAELNTLKDYGYDATLYANDIVNVRLAPGTDAGILTSLTKGDKVTVVGETSGWFKVTISGNIGYIRKDFLVYSPSTEKTDENNGEASAELNTETRYGSATTLYASSAVNIRTQPGTGSDVMGGLNAGDSVTVVGETDNWFIVSVNGTTGYVSKAYLTYDNSAGSNTDNENSGNASSGSASSGSASSGSQTIHGTITNFDMEYVTITGDDGSSYTVYYGDASTNSANGLFDGVAVDVTIDNSQTSSDGTLYATSVTGY